MFEERGGKLREKNRKERWGRINQTRDRRMPAAAA